MIAVGLIYFSNKGRQRAYSGKKLTLNYKFELALVGYTKKPWIFGIGINGVSFKRLTFLPRQLNKAAGKNMPF